MRKTRSAAVLLAGLVATACSGSDSRLGPVDDREHQQMMIDRVAEQDGRVLEFRLISDPDHAVIDRYGLLNQNDPRARPIPHPTVFVIDREGVVRWKFIEINYKIRPTNQDILEALEALHGHDAPDGEGG